LGNPLPGTPKVSKKGYFWVTPIFQQEQDRGLLSRFGKTFWGFFFFNVLFFGGPKTPEERGLTGVTGELKILPIRRNCNQTGGGVRNSASIPRVGHTFSPFFGELFLSDFLTLVGEISPSKGH